MRQHLMLVFELNLEHRIGKFLEHCRLNLYCIFLRHSFVLSPPLRSGYYTPLVTVGPTDAPHGKLRNYHYNWTFPICKRTRDAPFHPQEPSGLPARFR